MRAVRGSSSFFQAAFNYRALLSLVFSLAVRNGKIASNPVRLVKTRKENNERVRYLKEKEEDKLREKICELYPEGEPEFELALHTGMRRWEQCGLRWQDVNLERGTRFQSAHHGRSSAADRPGPAGPPED